MDQVQKDLLLQGAQEYGAEKYLEQAVKLLFKNKHIKIEIETCEWAVSEVSEKLILKIWYNADSNDVVLNILEEVFSEYIRKYDETIGIKTSLDMRSKIIVRLAYLLYKHRND